MSNLDLSLILAYLVCFAVGLFVPRTKVNDRTYRKYEIMTLYLKFWRWSVRREGKLIARTAEGRRFNFLRFHSSSTLL